MVGVERAILFGVLLTLGVFVSAGARASLPTNGPDAACLHRHHLPAFTAYSLGSSFEGLPRSGMFRFCFTPPRIKGVKVLTRPRPTVAWGSEADYGTCTPEGADGCDIPLEIQSWPECNRNFSSYGVASPKALPPATSHSLSGSYKIPTAQLEHGLMNRLEMYTGQTTIVIFAPEQEGATLVRRVAHALAQIVAPKVSSISAARLRAAAVSTRACR
jgi:hypothetical protein